MKDERKIKTRISICRPSGSGPELIEIEVIDDGSSVSFVTVQITPENFARALTGLGHVECDALVHGLNLVGKLREHKTELVPRPTGLRSDEKEAAKILAPFEVDGWVAYKKDLWNGHRRQGDFMSVTFTRHVDAPPTAG